MSQNKKFILVIIFLIGLIYSLVPTHLIDSMEEPRTEFLITSTGRLTFFAFVFSIIYMLSTIRSTDKLVQKLNTFSYVIACSSCCYDMGHNIGLYELYLKSNLISLGVISSLTIIYFKFNKIFQ